MSNRIVYISVPVFLFLHLLCVVYGGCYKPALPASRFLAEGGLIVETGTGCAMGVAEPTIANKAACRFQKEKTGCFIAVVPPASFG